MKEPPHVLDIEVFPVWFIEGRRDVRQVVSHAVPLRDQVDPVQVAEALSENQSGNGSFGDR